MIRNEPQGIKLPSLEEYREIQQIAKDVLSGLAATIRADDTERQLATRAVNLLAKRGIGETWYHDCPALVLLGSRSCLSISGRDYQPSEEMVGEFNLITIDLSPMRNRTWGDCARSFSVEHGRCVDWPSTPEFLQGLRTLQELHNFVKRCATPEMTFDALFQAVNAEIDSRGFENLDAWGNIGHTIEVELDLRRFIEPGNHEPIGRHRLFTIEPHLRQLGGGWGFKHENIYFFTEAGILQEL